jgi:dolichol-phosphate mannosyltransferase
MDISVVIPVYGCKTALPELHRRLVSTLESVVDSFEIILVDDCCPQNSWEVITNICLSDSRVKSLRFSRNFGQAKAITAGLDCCRGEWVVVMDCDLQDRPEFIKDLYAKACEGYDVVFARRIDRKDNIVTRCLSKLFYTVYDYFADENTDNSICNFSISKRIVIENYCRMREHDRAYMLFIKWLGFRQTAIDATADKRYEGESSYSLQKKLTVAFECITAQSNKPLKFSAAMGFIISFASFLYILYLTTRYYIGMGIPEGWTTIVVSIYFVGGLLMFAIGVLGLYIGNIFNEVKNRPLYVVAEKLNFDK